MRPLVSFRARVAHTLPRSFPVHSAHIDARADADAGAGGAGAGGAGAAPVGAVFLPVDPEIVVMAAAAAAAATAGTGAVPVDAKDRDQCVVSVRCACLDMSSDPLPFQFSCTTVNARAIETRFNARMQRIPAHLTGAEFEAAEAEVILWRANQIAMLQVLPAPAGGGGTT